MTKHKEVQRWAAGWELWEDKIFVVKATLVETKRHWRLKTNKDRTLGAAERQFSAAMGYSRQWNKDVYPTVGWSTKNGAIKGLCDKQAKLISDTEDKLRACKCQQEVLHEQLNEGSYKVLRTEHGEA